MNKYVVYIEESCISSYVIEAESLEKADAAARAAYASGEYSHLNPADVTLAQIAVSGPDGDTDWDEI